MKIVKERQKATRKHYLGGRTLQLACEDAGSEAGWRMYRNCASAFLSDIIEKSLEKAINAYRSEFILIQGLVGFTDDEYDDMLQHASMFAEEYRIVLMEHEYMKGSFT